MSLKNNHTPKIKSISKKLIGILCVLWGVIILIAYYMVHKPIPSDQLIALGRLGLTLIGLLGTLALTNLCARFLVPEFQQFLPAERIALNLGFGFGILGFFLLLVGSFGGYWLILAWVIVIAALPFGLPSLFEDIKNTLSQIPKKRSTLALIIFSLIIGGVVFLRALAPPTAWDALVYHLTGPKLYLQTHRLHHDVDIPYLGFPQAGSMIYLWALMLIGPELAQLFHFVFACLTLLLTHRVAHRVTPGREWFAVALLISIPSAALLAGWGYVEWITMYAGLASFVLIFEAGQGKFPTRIDGDSSIQHRNSTYSWKMFALVGFYSAMAFNTKYSAIPLVIGLGLAVILIHRSPRAFGIFVISFFVCIAPYLIKNIILTGNPVYPFFFPGKFWDEYRAFWYSRPGTGLNLGQLIIAPWEATVFGVEGATISGHPSYGATLGPVLLILVPFVLLRIGHRSSEQRNLLRGLILVSLVTYLFWLGELAYSALLVQTRLLFPVLPYLVMMAVMGFDALGLIGKWGSSARFILGGLIGFVLLVYSIETINNFISTSPMRVIVGQQSQDDYLVEQLGQYIQAIDEVNDLPQGERIMFLWESRSYYCSNHVQCEPDALLDRWWHLRRLNKDAADIASLWNEQGVTHVLIYHLGAQMVRNDQFDPLTHEDWQELDRFIQNHLLRIGKQEGAYSLYQLR